MQTIQHSNFIFKVLSSNKPESLTKFNVELFVILNTQR